MYTRSYSDEMKMPLPEGYGGTMLGKDDEPAPVSEPEVVEASAGAGGLLSRLIPSGLGKILPGTLFGSFKLGGEELLIGAVAIFMLLSSNGDKECAIMLLLLLFIT